ncbi:MAG: hypothetical protein A2036_03655 [Omnitrophica bacterium GWA2_50_21]|nr:MAG: hypothetical protein A2036_03655 [Omnitrophica bacterium GWA2_50_21]
MPARVLLIRHSYGEIVSRLGKRHNRRWPPLSLLICASWLEKEGLTVTVIDREIETFSDEAIFKLAETHDLIFLSSSDVDRWQCPNLDYDSFIRFASGFKNKGNLYLTGAHGTFYPEPFLKMTGAKGVIREEPEWTVKEIACGRPLDEITGLTYREDDRIHANPDRPPGSLDLLPAPAFHKTDLKQYYYELMGDRFTILEGSRGCSFKCTFCSLTMYGKGVRAKSSEKLIGEILAAKEAGARNIYFIDLEFTINKKLARDTCDFLIKNPMGLRWACQTRTDLVDEPLLQQMKRAGCVLIHYGVESGSQRILDSVDKRLKLEKIEEGFSLTRKAGIETTAFFMAGLPGETAEEREQTLAFAKKLNPTYASFHVANPYPSTKLGERFDTGEIFPEFCGRSEDDKNELKRFARRAFLAYYLRLGYILNHVAAGNPALWRRQARLFLSYL